MKIFAVVRDGNTHSAKSRGIEKNTYYIDVPFVEYDEIENFYSRRSEQLITHVNSYQSDYVQTNEKNVFDQVDFDLLKKHCPEICSPEECWEGRRCEKYCPVSEVCATIGNPYLENKEAGTCNSVVPGSTTDNKPVIASILKETYSKPPNGRNDAEN